MRAAILDLGTNTFNLLIADIKEGHDFHKLFFERIPVKLWEHGITSGQIAPPAFKWGLQAIFRHHQSVKKNQADQIFAYATSAIRDASNGLEFLDQVEKKFNFRPQIISGDREAELIYRGVKLAYPFPLGKTSLIIDIGGGSTEFILADNEKLLWKQSLKLGAARLLERFHPSDPIAAKEINVVENFFEKELQSLFKVGSKYLPEILIGSSGSFDTFADLTRQILPANRYSGEKYFTIPQPAFDRLYRTLLSSTLQERIKMPGMPEFRAETITFAAILTQFVLKTLHLKEFIQTFYALKEGVVWELMNN